MLWFVMAMVLYPGAAKKAQAEIDTVFNADTLPDFSRMKDLPYCFALLKEVIRFVLFEPRLIHSSIYLSQVVAGRSTVLPALLGRR
jgi:hypothetical protein